MTDPAATGAVVHVAADTILAYAEPSFIIERGGRYYVTTAVLEYDPNAPNLTPEQRDGVTQVEKLFRSGERGRVGVVELVHRIGAGQNTGPTDDD
ncbi:hypothetical protein [uncultured Sphingomonas sp.]|uniref:hypothetical protein n=1 Tax=uncultured Sphingomonas sp. TaxID=158754 RepID=UPI0035CC007E